MKFSVLSLFVTFSFSLIFAHEGHNHDAPKTLLPLKGGIIKTFSTEGKDGKKDQNCFVEVVKSKNDLKIYFFDANQKNVNAKDFELNVTAQAFSRNTSKNNDNGTALTLSDKKNFYLTSFDKKNAHKFDLVLKFTGPEYCKTNEEVTFIID